MIAVPSQTQAREGRAGRAPGAPQVTLVTGARAARSTIFLKLMMAGSGVLFLLFVLAHMYGNLKAFGGRDAYDEYAHHLRTLGEPMLPHAGFLWIMRVVLIGALVVYVVTAVILWRRARLARPVRYQVKKHTGATFASRLMRWGGLTILVFVIWHLLQFTIVKFNVGSGGNTAAITHDPYELVVHSFNVWWVTLIYVLAMIALGMHLRHGIWSASQTLGFTPTPRARVIANGVAIVVALIVAVGFVIPPLAIAFGGIK